MWFLFSEIVFAWSSHRSSFLLEVQSLPRFVMDVFGSCLPLLSHVDDVSLSLTASLSVSLPVSISLCLLFSLSLSPFLSVSLYYLGVMSSKTAANQLN